MLCLRRSLGFALMGAAMAAGCAEDRYSDRQRPVYSYENVDMGPQESGQEYRFYERQPSSDPYNESYSHSRSAK
jgi:hypothetical protein